MNQRIKDQWRVAWVLPLALGCGGEANSAPEPAAPPGVGEVCQSRDEDRTAFTGFQVSEALVETESAACATGICLVHGFQGRVSCPYGQDAASGACVTSFGKEPVSVAVEPQLVERPPRIASICSCPCRGEGPGPFCACPPTMECTDLLDSPSSGAPPADSFCVVKNSVTFRATGEVCDARLANCEDRASP